MIIRATDSIGPVTKVFDENGEMVPRIIQLDDETHEVKFAMVNESGIPLIESGQLRTGLKLVSGWTYQIGDDPPKKL